MEGPDGVEHRAVAQPVQEGHHEPVVAAGLDGGEVQALHLHDHNVAAERERILDRGEGVAPHLCLLGGLRQDSVVVEREHFGCPGDHIVVDILGGADANLGDRLVEAGQRYGRDDVGQAGGDGAPAHQRDSSVADSQPFPPLPRDHRP